MHCFKTVYCLATAHYKSKILQSPWKTENKHLMPQRRQSRRRRWLLCFISVCHIFLGSHPCRQQVTRKTYPSLPQVGPDGDIPLILGHLYVLKLHFQFLSKWLVWKDRKYSLWKHVFVSIDMAVWILTPLAADYFNWNIRFLQRRKILRTRYSF